MTTYQIEIEKKIAQWRKGELSIEMLRKLPVTIGRVGYQQAIPVLFELTLNGDEIVRYNAVMSLSFNLRWKAAKDLLCKVLEEDTDEDCRDAAAGGLGFLFEGNKDCGLIRVLARVSSADQDEDVRRSAFAALLRVSSRFQERDFPPRTGPRPPVDESALAEVLNECREDGPH